VSKDFQTLLQFRSKDGIVPILRSASEEHIRANLAVHEFTLDDEDRERIAAIDETLRCEGPEWMTW